MNLQENIHRIKTVMGLNEQKAPAKPAAKTAPAASQSADNSQLFVEALTHAANNMLAYVSQVKPGFIGVIKNSRGETKITSKQESYGPLAATHEMEVRFNEVTKTPTSKEDIALFDLTLKNANGEFSYEELTFANALQQYNQKTLTVARTGMTTYSSLGPGSLLITLMRMKLSMEQAMNLMKTVVPDIGVAIMTDLTQLEYNGVSAAEKQKYQGLITQLTPLVSGGQQPAAPQPK
jgi:hypothetical protein